MINTRTEGRKTKEERRRRGKRRKSWKMKVVSRMMA
jgi:hypothetical protein